MKLTKLYTESIAHLEPLVREALIREAPRTSFVSEIPEEFNILKAGFVDLNFETYHLPKELRDEIGLAFSSEGVAVPGTQWKLRQGSNGMGRIEPATGNEVMLPENWRRFVISANQGVLLWIGRSVRPEQAEGWDLSGMTETENGWLANG
jgi:hypothetical protein